MATVPVYLQDENGDQILDHEGNPLLIGSIETTETSFEDLLALLDLDAIQDAMRLAKTVRGNLQTFDIVGEEGDYLLYVNKQQLIGRFQSMETAIGSIAGTYLRRGGWLLGDIWDRDSGEAIESEVSFSFATTDTAGALVTMDGFLGFGDAPFDDLAINDMTALVGSYVQITFDLVRHATNFAANVSAFALDGVNIDLSEAVASGANVTLGGTTGIAATNAMLAAVPTSTMTYTLA